jgi:phage terminase small subunit
MPKGGFRPGAGRPRGPNSPLNNPPMPRVRVAPPVRRNSTEPMEVLSGTQWLQRTVNDPDADLTRRDKAAVVLATIENRKDLKPGKKEQAASAAKLAGYGTHWWAVLHDQDSDTFDPDGLTPEDRLKWDALHAKRQEQPSDPTKPSERRLPGIEDALRDNQQDAYPFRVPGERNPPPFFDEE